MFKQYFNKNLKRKRRIFKTYDNKRNRKTYYKVFQKQ